MLQIPNGKHIKRSIEMYTTLYLALFNSLLARLEDSEIYNEKIKQLLKQYIVQLNENENAVLNMEHKKVFETLERENFAENVLNFEQNCGGQLKFYMNFL